MEEMAKQTGKNDFPDTAIILNRTEWEQDTEYTPVYAVVSAVAEGENTDPVELPPLYDSINPDALNNLLTSQSESSLNQVSFQYSGYTIIVHGEGEVQVRPSTT